MKLFTIELPVNIYIFLWSLLGIMVYTYSFTNDLINQVNNQTIKSLIVSIALYFLCLYYCVNYIKLIISNRLKSV